MSENILYKGQFQLITKGQWVSIYIVGVIGVIGGSLSFFGDDPSLTLTFNLFFLAFCMLPVVVLFGIYKFISYIRKSAGVYIYKDRVEYSSTFFVKRISRIEASKIESVDVTDSLLGKSLYGQVLVRGSGSRTLRFNPIQQPNKLVEEIRKISSSSLPKPTDLKGKDLNANLMELNQMFKDGLLSDKEFEKAKNKLLN